MIKRLTVLILLFSGWLVTYGQTGRSSGLTIYGGKDMVGYDMVLHQPGYLLLMLGRLILIPDSL